MSVQLTVAEVDSHLVGFLSFSIYEGVGHIGWMSAPPKYHHYLVLPFRTYLFGIIDLDID